LFELPPPEVEAAANEKLATEMPADVRLGGQSWSYPGWRRLVYGETAPPEAITRYGLTAYGKHRLLRAVEIDRTYYEPLPASRFAELAAQVPDGFRFLVKAHEECSVARFPVHARYGKMRGAINPRYLDASYTRDHVVGPTAEGLGEKLGAVLFQFPPQKPDDRFAGDLHRFLEKLPKGVRYAVELRNAEMLTPQYGAALADTGVVHCHNAWSWMPDVLSQARALPPSTRSPLVIRWLVRRGDAFEDAEKRFDPYDRLREEDDWTRETIARLVARATQHGVSSLVTVSNHAEGCAPESIPRLAEAIRTRLTSR
jgi:uncharacterized protein YecE (DUF72 family)